MRNRLALLVLAALALAARPHATAAAEPSVPVQAVLTVGMTVANIERAVAFYTQVLPFTKEYDVEVSGRSWEQLHGVFGARARVVGLRLGEERLELTEYLAPRGRPFPSDSRANDRWFQHVAIIVSDMEKAYAVLRAHGVVQASTEPERLPDWNPGAGGIEAFYFHDPDGHFLEVLHFPEGKGDPRWHRTDSLFLGIDHTAITVGDTEQSLQFYRDTLGLSVAGAGENYGVEQEHLNNVFGVRLRITTLRARGGGAGVELLEYRAPRDGRPAPIDLRANDVAHWQITMTATGLAALLAPSHEFGLVSPDVTAIDTPALPFARALMVRDADGHAVRLVER